MKKAHGSSFVKGTIIGALAGAVAGLLFAPKSGKDTRHELAQKLGDIKDDLVGSLQTMSDELGGRVTVLKETASELGSEFKAESKDLIQKAEALKVDLRSSASKLSSRGKEAKEDTIDDAKRLLGQGGEVLGELEKLIKKVTSNAKTKLKQAK